MEGLSPPRRLELLPYGVSYAETEAKHPGNPDGRDYTGDMGFDLKYGLTSNITLDATVNPDFGQVEADETVLNLSTFETWYPEKRPFFLEGSKIFETPFNLFYSRRIGRPPSRYPDDADYHIDRPMATTILAAAKVSGKTAGGTSIGILESMTRQENATYIDTAGVRRSAITEPEANYLVARVKQDILRSSSIGVMATAVNQKNAYPAYTGGMDWNLRFRDGDYQFNGQVMGSSTGPETNGLGGIVILEKAGGEYFRGSISGEYESRDLDINRMGFLGRPDFKSSWMWFQVRTTDPWWIVRKTWNNFNIGYAENHDGVALTRGGNFNNHIELKNFWSVGCGSWVDYDATYSDYETRGGPPTPIPIGENWWVWFETDSRTWWQVGANVGGGQTWDGHYSSYQGWLEFRPRSNIEFRLEPGYRQDRGVSRWVTTLENDADVETDDDYIFGEQDMGRFDMTMRGTVTFTRDLTLQVYAQPFMAAVDYSNFKRLLPDESYEYVDASVYDEAEEEPDFSMASLNSNVVLRWEYRPGSTLFFVWTHARDMSGGDGRFDFNRDWDGLFAADHGNVFLVKLNYWWSL
jgi:hypothetical protein